LDNSDKASETQLERLIPVFYARVRDDALIGPVFDSAIGDWQQHPGKLIDFWSSVVLTCDAALQQYREWRSNVSLLGPQKGSPCSFHDCSSY